MVQSKYCRRRGSIKPAGVDREGEHPDSVRQWAAGVWGGESRKELWKQVLGAESCVHGAKEKKSQRLEGGTAGVKSWEPREGRGKE